jgi:purine-binding chemotaxis protein CheW
MSPDWDKVHAQLEASARTLREADDPTPAIAERILAERARVLAGATLGEESAPFLELVVFSRGEELYALPIGSAVEVVRPSEIVPVPGVPSSFAGVINFRGEILAVVDLHGDRADAPRHVTDTTRIVVMGNEEAELGLYADSVEGMRALHEAELTPAGGRDLLGVTRDGLSVLNGDALLADERFYVDQADERGGR